MAGRPPTTDRVRFDEKCKVLESGCIEWTGGRTSKVEGRGYGLFHAGKRMVPAHRWAFEQAFGPLGAGLDCCHRCDFRLCVNPLHLFEGTRLDNMRDCVAKGRTSHASRNPGEKHGNTTLTDREALQIRARAAAGESVGAMAREHKVAAYTIDRIVKRVTWKHI